MTSKQVMLTLMLMLLVVGCEMQPKPAEPLSAPYASRRVWAVAPLRNESGSLHADGLMFADRFVRALENAQGLDTLPVNRTLEAMQSLRLEQITSPGEAMQLMQALGADGLVVGTLTAYDPYDPPKVGIAVELYLNKDVEKLERLDPRALSEAAVDRGPLPGVMQRQQPVSVASAFLDAADPQVRQMMKRFAVDRGVEKDPRFVLFKEQDDQWRLYRISIDLYAEFVGYEMSRRLLDVERQRLSLASAASTPTP
jgi:hypothetical protein